MLITTNKKSIISRNYYLNGHVINIQNLLLSFDLILNSFIKPLMESLIFIFIRRHAKIIAEKSFTLLELLFLISIIENLFLEMTLKISIINNLLDCSQNKLYII